MIEKQVSLHPAVYLMIHDIIQMCSGITHGRVLNGDFYAQRFQNLIYLHLFTDCFMTISIQSSEPIQFRQNQHNQQLSSFRQMRRNLHETVCK